MNTLNICQSESTKKSIDLVDFSTQETLQKIVFIDSHVEDYQSLANGVLPGFQVVMLEPNVDGIQQITNVIQKSPQISSIHIVSHGTPGCLQFGSSQLNIKNINDYARELETWCVANILLYGCSVAAGDAGAEFIEKLHQLTGAEIAASTTKIGHAAQDGNWELDVKTSQFEATVPFSAQIQTQWFYVLADTDGDLVDDTDDIDDDNDGILDTEEGLGVFTDVAEINTGGHNFDEDLSNTTINNLGQTSSNSFTFTSSLQGTATWSSGVQLIEDGSSFDNPINNFIQVQPKDTDLANGNAALYVFEYENATPVSLIIGGMNNDQDLRKDTTYSVSP